jgi:hypothetical protein
MCSPCSEAMFSDMPSVCSDVFFSDLRRLFLQRRGHRVVEAIHESEIGNKRRDFHDPALRPMLLHPIEQFVGHLIGLRRSGDREFDCDTLGIGIQRARFIFPYRSELLIFDASLERPPALCAIQ